MRDRKRTRLPGSESHGGNSTAVRNSVDEGPKAFSVILEIPDETITVEVAGLDRNDAARRARWSTIREKACEPGNVRVVGAREIPTESAVAS